MDRLEHLADLSIRRACAFVGLAMVTVMISLSFDLMLAFRTGAQIAACLALGLGFAAWRTPRRNIRHSEVYAMLRSTGLPSAHLGQAKTRARIVQVLRTRLIWHAERVALLAVTLWALAIIWWAVGGR